MANNRFFRALDWEKLRTFRPPFVPQLTSMIDTSYFPLDDMEKLNSNAITGNTMGPNTMDLVRNPNKDLAFVGYTFKRWETLRNEL